MPKGKLATQVAHAAVSTALKTDSEKIKSWKNSGMKKVVLKVKNNKELNIYQQLARKERIVNSLVTDAGKTFFKSSTITCLAIGPDEDNKLDKVISKLKLL